MELLVVFLFSIQFPILASEDFGYGSEDFRLALYANNSELRLQTEVSCLNYSQIDPTYVRSSCKIFLMHIHKAGGSTICGMAKLNNYTVPAKGKTNCNLISPSYDMNLYDNQYCTQPGNNKSKDILWHLFSHEEVKSCVLTQPYQFIAAETYGGLSFPLASSILHVTVVRNPLDMCISLIKHERKYHLKNSSDWGHILHYPLHAAFIKSDRTPNSALKYYCSNAIVKSLTGCGRSVCGEIHLEIAKRILQLSSVIIITENFQRDVQTLKMKFGWKKGQDLHLNRGSIKQANSAFLTTENVQLNLRKQFPHAFEILQRWNDLDLMFFKYADSMAIERYEEAIRKYSFLYNSSS